MSIKIVKKLLMILTVLVIIDTISIPVYAKDSVTCTGTFYTSPTKRNEQVRYIKVVKDPVWTKLKTVGGQPTKGTYVKKGDSLYYGSSGGTKAPITLSVGVGATYGYGSASVSLNIPIGKASSSSYYGKILTASKSGYYLIKAKKKVQVTVMFKQYRHRKTNNPYSNSGKWGSWGKAKVSSKKYKTIKTYSKLVRQ